MAMKSNIHELIELSFYLLILKLMILGKGDGPEGRHPQQRRYVGLRLVPASGPTDLVLKHPEQTE